MLRHACIDGCHWQLAASALAHHTGGQAASGTRIGRTTPHFRCNGTLPHLTFWSRGQPPSDPPLVKGGRKKRRARVDGQWLGDRANSLTHWPIPREVPGRPFPVATRAPPRRQRRSRKSVRDIASEPRSPGNPNSRRLHTQRSSPQRRDPRTNRDR